MSANSVTFVAADPEWSKKFITEKKRLLGSLQYVAIEHIGSTSIANMDSKPIIDMLVGVYQKGSIASVLLKLKILGYVLEGKRQGHYWLCSPIPKDREFIVHLVEYGDEEWRRRIGFRDYLVIHPQIAAEYQSLKRNLSVIHANDLDGYTAGKAKFVRTILELVGQ